MIATCPKCGARNRIDDRARTATPVCGRCGTALPPAAAENSVRVITDETFENDVLHAAVPVLLDCWAPWCGPCRMLAPTLESLAGESGGRFIVGKLNVDENPGVASRFRISSIPNVLLFHHGNLIEQIVGLRDKQAYLAAVDRAMK